MAGNPSAAAQARVPAMKSCTLVVVIAAACLPWAAAVPLPGTGELEAHGDLAAQMVDGLHRFFDRETAQAARNREARFTPESESPAQRQARRDAGTAELRRRLGLDPVPDTITLTIGGFAGTTAGRQAHHVSWPVVRNVRAEGVHVAGDSRCVIVLPELGTTPEQSFGLTPGLPPERQWAARLAADGATVLAVALLDRRPGAPSPDGRSFRYSQREVLWRAAFELGRAMAGCDAQTTLAAAEALRRTRPTAATVHLIGSGDGGYIALLAGASSPGIDSVAVEGGFLPLDPMWDQPLDRTVFGLLRSFGLPELAALVAPRPLAVLDAAWPEVRQTDAGGGAPGSLRPPTRDEQDAAIASLTPERVRSLWPDPSAGGFTRHPGTDADAWLARAVPAASPSAIALPSNPAPGAAVDSDNDSRQSRQFRTWLDDTQQLMRRSQAVRDAYWKAADMSSPEKFEASAATYRETLWTEVIGKLPPASLAPNPLSRRIYETPDFTGWEVTLDVHPDIFAYGILLLPRNLAPGERRPVVVCQHGLEGRPSDVADPAQDNPAYHRYAARLAEKGYIVFAPQNPYIGQTRFRQLCQRAWPLGLSLWSPIVRQHETILAWLKSRPEVDPARIAFYGLSYGGKTAVRVPALLTDYCLSICSADYNEWIWKNLDASAPYCYLHTVEYDMVEWNLAHTFNYAELTRLIFPRPFMVERGHDDGVSCDEWVAYEFARTRRHYSKLGSPEHAEIEFFNGPHTINGIGTFQFLDRWLAK